MAPMLRCSLASSRKRFASLAALFHRKFLSPADCDQTSGTFGLVTLVTWVYPVPPSNIPKAKEGVKTHGSAAPAAFFGRASRKNLGSEHPCPSVHSTCQSAYHQQARRHFAGRSCAAQM